MLYVDIRIHVVYSFDRCGNFPNPLTGSSAGASALGSGPRGRRFKSSLPDLSG